MALQSQLFRGDSKLEAAAVSDPAHIVPGTKGPHVGKIQQALIQLDGAPITADSAYGPATAAAVVAFKRKRGILNFQGQIDNIVGKKTMAALDTEMLAKERGSGGGGGGGAVPGGNRQGFVAPVSRNVTHTLVYFSGVQDDQGRGGLPLPPNADEVFSDMGNLTTVNSGKNVVGFGGSLRNKQLGVAAALAIIATTHDRRAKLIIYGFSAGGVNGLDLCRALAANPLTADVAVNLLVTVDAAGAGEFVDRNVPSNVGLNRNYFQTTPSLRGSRGGPAVGRNVVNISKDNAFSIFLKPNERHGAMNDLTRSEARADMQKELTATR